MKPNRWDILIGIGIIIFSGVLFFWGTGHTMGSTATVFCEGEVFCQIPLNEDARISVKEQLVVVVEGRAIHIEKAVCADMLCEKHRPISRAGESIVCLPSQIVVSVNGEGMVDAIAQ